MPGGPETYIALPTRRSTDDLLELDDFSTGKPKDCRTSCKSIGQPNRLVFWATVCAVCSTLLSFSVTFANITASRTLAARPTKAARWPNPFVNLDRVLAANATMAFDPIVNFPPVVLQIANRDPHRGMHEDTRDCPTAFGAIYPDDRHIVISHKVSTIIQFHNLDYGMERCALYFEVPRPYAKFDPMVNITEDTQVHIWALDSPTELSRYIPHSMERAPKRQALLTTFHLSGIEPVKFGTFECPSGEFTTLELTCLTSGSTCHVDFWQDKRAKPLGGFYLKQYPSIIDDTHTKY